MSATSAGPASEDMARTGYFWAGPGVVTPRSTATRGRFADGPMGKARLGGHAATR